jgi:DNA repair protein RadA/Sms
MEGRRPLLAEVQALVTPAPAERPRRTTSGLDSSRVAMVLAVLQQHGGIRAAQHDVFARPSAAPS